MTKAAIEKYRDMLEVKEMEIITNLRDKNCIRIEPASDAMDETQQACARDLAILALDRESAILRFVESALLRIENEKYGICQHCEGSIAINRLDAVPWAPYCIKCQDWADKNPEEAADEKYAAAREISQPASPAEHKHHELVTHKPQTSEPPSQESVFSRYTPSHMTSITFLAPQMNEKQA